jgi:D-citramalate synthase
MKIELMDTTLRDGEQTSGVSFSANEKLAISQLLINDIGVDRIEVASARVSEGELEAVSRIVKWANTYGHLRKIEVLGFVDNHRSIDWLDQVGGKVLNLLTKGSLKHVEGQLKKTPEEHAADISSEVKYATELGIDVNIYLEDWSNGMIHSPEYVFQMMDALKELPIKRFMLPDTLGILSPPQTADFCSQMIAKYPTLHFDFHPHNDYDLAVANIYEAVRVGIKGVHTTVNGLGERAGNAPLSSVIGILHDLLKSDTNLKESRLAKVSKMVETFSGVRVPSNKPLVGEFVFTQCAGIHADGDNKNNLYFNDLLPERFGRLRSYALGKTSGKANIKKNLDELGIELDVDTMKLVTQKVIELGDEQKTVKKEDLPLIIADVIGNRGQISTIKILNYSLALTHGLRPVATVKVEIQGKDYQATSPGSGQYDAFSRALSIIYKKLDKPRPYLADYIVTIPPGGRTDALVETSIHWEFKGNAFQTRGVDTDQTEAAIQATIRMLNIIETMQ